MAERKRKVAQSKPREIEAEVLDKAVGGSYSFGATTNIVSPRDPASGLATGRR